MLRAYETNLLSLLPHVQTRICAHLIRVCQHYRGEAEQHALCWRHHFFIHNLSLLESAHLWHRTGSLLKIFRSAQFQWGCRAIHLSPSQASKYCKYCKYCKWCQASPSQAQKCFSFLLQERSVQRVECPNDICATSHASLQPIICRIFQHSVVWNSEGNVRIEQSPTQTFHIQHGVNNMNKNQGCFSWAASLCHKLIAFECLMLKSSDRQTASSVGGGEYWGQIKKRERSKCPTADN